MQHFRSVKAGGPWPISPHILLTSQSCNWTWERPAQGWCCQSGAVKGGTCWSIGNHQGCRGSKSNSRKQAPAAKRGNPSQDQEETKGWLGGPCTSAHTERNWHDARARVMCQNSGLDERSRSQTRLRSWVGSSYWAEKYLKTCNSFPRKSSGSLQQWKFCILAWVWR